MAQQRNRARQRAQQRLIVILMLVVLAAGAFFLFGGDKEEPKKRIKPREPAGMVKIPTLKKSIKPGTRINKKMIRYVYRAPNDVPTDAVLAKDQFIGRFTTETLLKNDYVRESAISADGAQGRYSAMAKPGMRLVVLNAGLFPSSLHTLRIGDRVDILALQGSLIANRSSRGPRINSGAVSGAQPGSGGNTKKRANRNRAKPTTTLSDPGTLSATLVAENAEVMSVPVIDNRGRNLSRNNALILQMKPQDAHITTLMAASNTKMRVVFRPFGDDTRLTQPKPVKVTTRLPKPLADPDSVNMIVDGQTYLAKPNSQMFRTHEDMPLMQEQPNVIYGRSRVVDKPNEVDAERSTASDVQEFDTNG